jgi:hypothetical protein
MRPIGRATLYTEALRRSRNIVRRELKAKGIRESSFKASELTAFAKAFLEANRQVLITRAMTDLVWARTQNMCTEFRGRKINGFHCANVTLEGVMLASVLMAKHSMHSNQLCELLELRGYSRRRSAGQSPIDASLPRRLLP